MSEHRRITRAVLATYRQAEPDFVEAGKAWYPAARARCELMAGEHAVSLEHAVVAVAHLSPRQPWSKNLELAGQLLAGEPRPRWALRATWATAQASLASDTPLDTFSRRSLKTRSFAQAILGSRSAVVVDIWMARLAGVPENSVRTIAGYHLVADAIRRGAKRVQLAPSELQAITWCCVRGASD